MCKFYKTKMTVELEVSTQFGPESAINVITVLVGNVPAIKSVRLTGISTDYVPLTPEDHNRECMKNIPFTIK